MKKMNQYPLLVILLLLSCSAFAQGTIRGTVYDLEFQEPLIGAVVKVNGTSEGAVTDIEGAYSINVPAGTYTVSHSYIGLQEKVVTEVVVKDGEVNSLGQVDLGVGEDGNALGEVVVTAYVQKNSEEGLLNFQRNSAKIVDAISAQSITKTGDSDVAAVVKRVPGVTVEGGKYVYVRGLGDRYSKSIVNGMDIPGLDPERNTVQMDIFPSNIIDNVVVYKTFSPDLTGDFTGGMVDVITKDFPLEKSFKFSAGLGYNTLTTFNSDYISSDFGYGDVLGFGKANRKLPFSKDVANGASNEQLADATRQLDKNVSVTNGADNLLNQKISLSYGNQFDVGEHAIGFTAAINAKRDYQLRDNWSRNDIGFLNGGETYSRNVVLRDGLVGNQDGMLNGILNTAYKFGDGKVGLKLMHTRTGEGTVSTRRKDDIGETQIFDESIIDYFQRTITNGTLSTDLFFGEAKDVEFDASISGTKSTIDNPERSNVNMFINSQNGNYVYASNSDFTKEWRELAENNISGKANILLPISKQSDLGSNVKFGLSSNFKDRDFEPIQLKISPSSPFASDLVNLPNNNIDYILLDENIAQANGNSFTKQGYVINNVKLDEENIYQSDMLVNAAYAMTDYKFNEKLKFIGGLRVEQAIMNFLGSEGGNTIDAETLNSVKYLPSANFVYELKDYMNLRASYNKTLARPSFKEKSAVNIYDAILGQFFIGNLGLVETDIDNFDLRWEYYFDNKEMVSLSPFYKKFTNPIEMKFNNIDQITPINKDEAFLYGFETEFRKDFGFVNQDWEKLAFNGNFTFVQSEIDLTPNEKVKYNGVIDAPNSRTLVGQSPYSINTGLSYSGNAGFDANLSYNVKGKTLNIIGFSSENYDIYEDPFHNLDLKLSKKLGGKFGSKVSVSASNLLGDDIDYYYSFDGKRVGDYRHYDIGRTFSIGYAMDLSGNDEE